MCQCYLNLSLYEDALAYANKALEIDPAHYYSLFRKARALCFLFEFEESIKLFK